jgi:hypothetical protein
MPTRSIKLKFVVPRAPGHVGVRSALWTTHCAINEAVAFYEEQLLLMRGAEYVTLERVFPGEQVRESLLQRARAAQERNRHSDEAVDTEICQLLRRLYECIVPSAIEERGSAQNANAFLSPLTDYESTGFMSVFDKIGDVPPWVEGFRTGEASATTQANEWRKSKEGQRRVRATGAPPRWVRLARENQPDWPQTFIEDLDKKRDQAQGAPTIVKRLKDVGILPMFLPVLAPRIRGAEGVICPWDRLAFRLAVAHLLSWESWCRLAATEYAARTTRVEQFQQRYITEEIRPQIEALRRYETERSAELDRIAQALGETQFHITLRMTRGWSELREKWLKAKSPTEEHLHSIIAAEQTKQRGRFGDPHLFRWLARPENHSVWNDQRLDAVSVLARLNAMMAIRDRSRQSANYTRAEPRAHPRSAQWEAMGGSNLKTYTLARADNGTLRVDLPLLTPSLTYSDGFEESSFSFSLAPTDQLRDDTLSANGKDQRIDFKATTDEVLHGTLRSADLLLNWTYLRNRNQTIIAAGDIGAVYFKLALDLDPILPAGWDGRRPQALIHFCTSLSQKSKFQSYLAPGLRVLSVDLGLRSFGTCSVYELKDTKPDRGLWFSLLDLELWAVHERSFTVNLPDERVGADGERWQNDAYRELRKLRRTLNRYRSLYRTVELPADERLPYVESILDDAKETDTWPFEAPLLRNLAAHHGDAQPVWTEQITATLRTFRSEFGIIVSEWRTRTRKRTEVRSKYFGRSMWALDYLTSVRRFLQSWSLLGRQSGEIRRLSRERGGIFATRLLDHLNNIKDDRLKTGADLIVQAARGYLRNRQGQWHQTYAPCHAVLFEDLTRYRMRTDRPRRENSMLMKWAHRAIPKEVEMQGELYGIYCEETSASFSSRYHAASGAPGIRCHSLKVDDLNDSFFREMVERENPGINLGDYKVGDLMPRSGGELFACCNSTGVTRLHADINAAQNLQRRFWTRHADAFRIVASRATLDQQEIWLPQRLGKRLLGGLGGYGYLVPTGHQTGSCRWQAVSAARWRRLAGQASLPDSENASSTEAEELAGLEDEMLEQSGVVKVFFRDPSGFVLPSNLWYPSITFWSVVKAKTTAVLKHKKVE